MISMYRKKKGYTQEKFAEILGISTRHLQRIENNITNSSFKIFIKIINLLEIPDEEIIKILRNIH